MTRALLKHDTHLSLVRQVLLLLVYAIYLNNQQHKTFKRYAVKISRIINGQETELISTDDVIVQNSDSNHQVILKFQGLTMYELLTIIYEVIKL
jgi:hypothetical protein